MKGGKVGNSWLCHVELFFAAVALFVDESTWALVHAVLIPDAMIVSFREGCLNASDIRGGFADNAGLFSRFFAGVLEEQVQNFLGPDMIGDPAE